MSATRHATDANTEAARLGITIEEMCARALLGVTPTAEDLAALHRSANCVRYHTARAVHALAMFPIEERRDQPVAGREALEGMLVLDLQGAAA